MKEDFLVSDKKYNYRIAFDYGGDGRKVSVSNKTFKRIYP